MTKPADAIKAVIDETLAPRFAAHHARLAGARPDPLPVARTDLHYVWDDYGNQYLDFASGMHPIGHRHAAVLNAITDHNRHYHFSAPLGHHLARWPVQYAKDLAGAFQRLSGVDTKVLFCEGEREAVRKACALAVADTGRQVAVLDTGWHGWLGETVAAEPVALGPEHGALLLATVDTAALPVPVEPWIAAARALGIPVIVDESVTGFGRTGPMWSAPPDGADLTVLGGPVGGTLPLGAVIGPADYFTPGGCDVSPQAGNPIACAAGAAVHTLLQMGILDHVAETAPVLTSALTELADQFPDQVAGHHGKGHLRGIRLRAPDPQFHLRARTAGLLVAPPVGDVIVIAPPLVASPLELKRGVDMLADALLSWDDETDQVNRPRSVQNQ